MPAVRDHPPKRLREEFGDEGFMGQKGLWSLAKKSKLEGGTKACRRSIYFCSLLGGDEEEGKDEEKMV